jgi:hypothetical protein
MPYSDRIQRWVVVRLNTATDRTSIARFVKFSDAEGYAQALNRSHPTQRYLVMFDAQSRPADGALSQFSEQLLPELLDLSELLKLNHLN